MDKLILNNNTYILGEIIKRNKSYTLIKLRYKDKHDTKKVYNDTIKYIDMVDSSIEGVFKIKGDRK